MNRRQPQVTKAVFFDVDFTLIYPGPAFEGLGYREFCARHGVRVEAGAFEAAVASASVILDEAQDHIYDPALFIRYTRHIIEQMGGRGAGVEACALEIHREWAACHHFELYEDVEPVFRELAGAGIRIGLISNTHRCLASFRSHFELDGLVSAAISSSDHGFMKPHPSIFEAALRLLDVPAAEAVMVGDSPKQDIDGARRVGMRGVLVRRSQAPIWGGASPVGGVPVIRTLRDLPPLL